MNLFKMAQFIPTEKLIEAAIYLRWISVLDLAVSISHEPEDGDREGEIQYPSYNPLACTA